MSISGKDTWCFEYSGGDARLRAVVYEARQGILFGIARDSEGQKQLDTYGSSSLRRTELGFDCGAMAYIHLAQIPYRANCTSGPSGPKIKPLK